MENIIAQASKVKRDAITKSDKEIRWAITAVYELHWQHELMEALDEARYAMEKTCDERE